MNRNIIVKRPSLKAQAMVEFALALPIVLLLVIGMLEVGRLIVYYSAVNSAARDGARYGAATGLEDGIVRYCNAARIRAAAANAGFFAGVQPTNTADSIITITYDTGPGATPVVYDPCAAGAKLLPGTRIVVTVDIMYRPSINFPSSNLQRHVIATSARSITGKVSLPDALP